MIVWGGYALIYFVDTGGRYNPGRDSWTATSTTNAPVARFTHTAVWTGTEMIVWGGWSVDSVLNTGGNTARSSVYQRLLQHLLQPQGLRLPPPIHADSNANPNGNGYGDPDGNCYGNAAVYTDTAAAPDSGTAPVAFINEKKRTAQSGLFSGIEKGALYQFAVALWRAKEAESAA